MRPWYNVPKYDGLIEYLIGSGRVIVDVVTGAVWVRHAHSGRYFRPKLQPDRKGYARLKLRYDGRLVSLGVARIVWVAWYGPTNHEIDHRNDDCTDDRLENLQALTGWDNEQKRHGKEVGAC